MKLCEICVKRPVFTTVLSLLLIVIGIIYYQQLSIRELPDIQEPVITVFTKYPGASAELVENAVTVPIENALADLSGLVAMTSTSSAGVSKIRLFFNQKVAINEIMEDIRNKLGAIRDKLPDDITAPIAKKMDENNSPGLILTVQDDKRSAMAVSDYVRRNLLPELQQIEGVGSAQIWGERKYAVRIWLDTAKMMAHNITVANIVEALKSQNMDIPSGQISNADRTYTLVTQAKFNSVDEFKALVLHEENNKAITLPDVAKIELAPEVSDETVRMNGKPTLGIAVFAQATANPLQVFEAVGKRIAQIQTGLPAGMSLHIVYDNSAFIKESIQRFYHSLAESFVLVLIVILLFLGNWRSALIPIVTIPVCLIAVFWPMHVLGFSINYITLMALVLSIGLVVDDAIVMLENIYRHVESGKTPYEAALLGSREISFAIVAMTLTLAAVYAPSMFAQGFIGITFQAFGLTLAVAVIISGFVALTLSPMMCAKLLERQHIQNHYTLWLEKFFNQLQFHYKRYLTWQLTHSRWVIVALILFSIGGWLVYRSLPSELAPKEDIGVIVGAIKAPTDASYQYTDRYARQLEAIYALLPELQHYIIDIESNQPNSAMSFLILKPLQQRSRSQQKILAELETEASKITGAKIFFREAQVLGGGNNSENQQSISLKLMSTGNYYELNQLIQFIKARVEKLPAFKQVSADLEFNSQHFEININRSLAANLQVKMSEIADTISTMMGGKNPIQFTYQGYDYPVILQLQDAARQDLAILQKLYVRSQTDKLIPLASLIKIKETVAPKTLAHYDRLRATELSANLNSGYGLGDGIKLLQQLLPQLLPDNAKYEFTGEAKQYLEASNRTGLIFLLALVFIYLVLAAQFESFINPLTILLTVPLCIVGALLTLKLRGDAISIYTNIAMITLIGLIAKHGILITEFANQLRAQGRVLKEAIIEAAALRLRPILMTTAAMVLGALPLAFASGASAASRQQVGWVIVGGMLFGTFFSLVIVPVAYTVLAKKSIKDC